MSCNSAVSFSKVSCDPRTILIFATSLLSRTSITAKRRWSTECSSRPKSSATLKQQGAQILDSNALERERGITILAKNTAVTWDDVKINIVDTPGHADFGGEVERVLNMVDGALLLVDAVEGPMPQTRFVLRKALAAGLRVIVVINKVDRPYARPRRSPQRDVRPVHRTGRERRAGRFPGRLRRRVGRRRQATRRTTMQDNLIPLFETIIKEVPAPDVELDMPPRLLVTTLEYDNYKGQIGVGRLHSGVMKRGMPVVRITPQGERSDRTHRVPVHLSQSRQAGSRRSGGR